MNKLICIPLPFFISIWKAQNKQSNALYPVYEMITYMQSTNISTEVSSFMKPNVSKMCMIEASSIFSETKRILYGLFQEKYEYSVF